MAKPHASLFASAMIFAALLVGSCSDKPGEWTGWAYPNANDLTQSVSLTGLESFQECQIKTIAVLRSFPDPDKGDYECGRSCKWNPTYETNVCKETKK